MTSFLLPPASGFLGRTVGRDLLLNPTNWVPRATRTFEFRAFEHLDHLIAGCVTTAAKSSSISANPICRPAHEGTAAPFGWPLSLEPLHRLEWFGGCRGDALAEMPLVKPRAQLAFKDSMIRGILQFTLRIAFRCVLHRCKSQDIRC